MRNKLRSIALAAVIILVAIVGFVFSQNQPTDTNEIFNIISDDGLASLAVPESAAADGVTLKRMTGDDYETTDDELAGMLVYSMEPDGMAFDQPATFTTTIDSPEGYIPRVYHISEGEMPIEGSDEPLPFVLELVDNVTYTYDADNTDIKIEVPINHFSTLVIDSMGWAHRASNWAFFQFSESGDKKLVGQVVKPKAVVKQTTATTLSYGNYPDNTTYRGVHAGAVTGRWFVPPSKTYNIHKKYDGLKGQPSLRFTLVPNSARLSSGVIRQGKKKILTPNQEFKNKPSNALLNKQYSIPSSEFSCAKADYDYVEFDVRLTWTEKGELQRAWDPKWRKLFEAPRSLQLNIRPYVACEAAAPTSGQGPGVSITDPDPDKLNCSSVTLTAKENGGKEVAVHKLKDNRCYTSDQFSSPSAPDECKEKHYHTTLKSLDGHTRNDSQPCGAAVESDIVKTGKIWIKS